MDVKIENIRKKIMWDRKEIKKIDNIINAVAVKPKRLDYSPGDSFVEFEGKRYDGILRHRLYDWFDVAKIIDYLELCGASFHSSGKVGK